MELLSTRSFYFFIIMQLTVNFMPIQAFGFLQNQFVVYGSALDQKFLSIFTTLKNIKNCQKNLEEHMMQDRLEGKNFIDEILVVLIGTYQKIVTATVTYYLMLNHPGQYNLHQAVALILVEDMMKISKIIGDECIHIVADQSIDWEGKIYYLVGSFLAIMAIKYGIDMIPQPIIAKNDENSIVKKNEKEEAKSGYLIDKFSNYK